MPVRYFISGGAVLDAPLVYASWGLSPSDHPQTAASVGTQGVVPSLGTVVKAWADDFVAVDVRGRVAVVLRMPNIQTSGSRNITPGQDFETTVKNVLKRGALALLYIDPTLSSIQPTPTTGAAFNPYRRLEETLPLERSDGVPVIVISLRAAERLLGRSACLTRSGTRCRSIPLTAARVDRSSCKATIRSRGSLSRATSVPARMSSCRSHG